MDSQQSAFAGSPVETAQRMLDLIHDLGECQDSREVLICATRHMRVLFGDYWVATLVTADPDTGHWRVLPLENPYEASWGGVPHHMIPPKTDTDEIVRFLGREAHTAITTEGVLTRTFVEGKEPFVAVDDALAMRIAAMAGAPCRTFMGASWKRPEGGERAWLALGFPEPLAIGADALKLYQTTVETMARLAHYPALVNYIERREKMNQSVRRNIVHDLKTPITVIRGYMETLLMEGVWDDAATRLELSGGILESCDLLLEDIYDLLQPVDMAWVPEKTEFDLAQVVARVILAEKHTERARSHEFVLEGADSQVMVWADMRKIRRVLENLLSNAVKYSPGEEKRVWVDLQVDDSYARVMVRDEGLGLDDTQLDKVMNEAGRAVDPALGIEGTGFGLSSTRAVLEAHGGRLTAESCVGVGSTFGFVLPLGQTN